MCCESLWEGHGQGPRRGLSPPSACWAAGGRCPVIHKAPVGLAPLDDPE